MQRAQDTALSIHLCNFYKRGRRRGGREGKEREGKVEEEEALQRRQQGFPRPLKVPEPMSCLATSQPLHGFRLCLEL